MLWWIFAGSWRICELIRQLSVFNMSAGKCKRGLDVLQSTTSSSSDDDSPRSANTSATTTTESGSPSQCDYDTSSPGSSSTLSGGGGPSVIRLPGFVQHSQQTPHRHQVKKKKAEKNTRSGDVLSSLETPRSEHTAGQLTSSRLTKHQLTPRTKPPRGLLHFPFISNTSSTGMWHMRPAKSPFFSPKCQMSNVHL